MHGRLPRDDAQVIAIAWKQTSEWVRQAAIDKLVTGNIAASQSRRQAL